MDPLTTASALATIVGLLADFASHRSDQKTADLPEFMGWLRTHGHEEVMKAIEASHLTSISIKAALTEGNRQLLARLSSIDKNLATLCEAQGPLGDLAKSLHPSVSLSEQAKSFLIAFERARAGKALEVHSMDGLALMFLDAQGEIDIQDGRFYEDDISRLVELGLFRATHNSRGERVLNITRDASTLAQTLIAKEKK